METIYKNCQSCGMPMKRDPQRGGTEADGSKSTMYCSYCYQSGKFTQPSLSMDEMKVLVKGKLKEMKIPGILAGIFTRNIPKLARWKSTHH
jgi:Putative zinc ribbon domain